MVYPLLLLGLIDRRGRAAGYQIPKAPFLSGSCLSSEASARHTWLVDLFRRVPRQPDRVLPFTQANSKLGEIRAYDILEIT